MTFMGDQVYSMKSWFPKLYPGNDVVDWIAWDPYTCDKTRPCHDLKTVLNLRYLPKKPWPGFYNWAHTHHRSKPLMLAEWGVLENGNPSRKRKYLKTVRPQMSKFPRSRRSSTGTGRSPR